jgi:glycosyltransferase involved in cell wall biosynthesis
VPLFATTVLSRRVHRGMSYANALRIDALARRLHPDLVFSRDLRGCLLPALRGVPTVFEAHTLSSLTGWQERVSLRRLAAARGFRGIVAISAPLAEDLVTELEVDPDRILVAHDAVTDPGDDTIGRHRRGAEEPLRIIYTGSLFPGKGADILLAAAARCPWARFSIAGGPADLAHTLRERAAEQGLVNVELPGPLRPVDARALQAQADILTAPFSHRVESDSGHDIARWTSPMKVFEYMASGRPMVVSDLPVLREVLRKDVDALMVPPEDLDALVGAFERLRDDAALGDRLATSALRRVRSEFTWEIRARRILERFGA